MRGTRIPNDFAVTPVMVAWAHENAPDVDGKYQTTKFINYWRAKAGKDATKVDWAATWHNWMLKAQEDSGRIPIPAQPETPRPAWCRQCDEKTRMAEDADRRPVRCPRCHPLNQKDDTP